MLTSLLLASLAARQGAPTAAGLISTMLRRYADAKSLSATIHTTQSAGNVSVVTDTKLSFERPGKIRLDQIQKGATIRRKGLLVCDGNRVVYSKPEYLQKDEPYLFEPSAPANGIPRTTEQLYDLVGSALPDRSPVLDVIAGGVDDRKYFAGQLAVFELKGQETVNGKVANAIEGEWRETPDQRMVNGHFSGRFTLYITNEGEIVRYVLSQKFAQPAATSRQGRPVVGSGVVDVVTTWDATVDLAPTFKANAFALVE